MAIGTQHRWTAVHRGAVAWFGTAEAVGLLSGEAWLQAEGDAADTVARIFRRQS